MSRCPLATAVVVRVRLVCLVFCCSPSRSPSHSPSPSPADRSSLLYIHESLVPLRRVDVENTFTPHTQAPTTHTGAHHTHTHTSRKRCGMTEATLSLSILPLPSLHM
ncbi:hypothetical protein BZA05DRAFT_396639 [Tricharina praecox]|uniref:uncharacterized protein n=1 Tax=Tricharina praecox TaxID=43433 RepID=UPI0022204D40|nr:uncharacterized protein BZA05DRAFT_396639 [Tricharina praecox]KAI5853606.1 hypothetical protein BZA05DRAFT_396639 [Tricharina praecox]